MFPLHPLVQQALVLQLVLEIPFHPELLVAQGFLCLLVSLQDPYLQGLPGILLSPLVLSLLLSLPVLFFLLVQLHP